MAKDRASGNVDGVRRKELRRLGDANVRRNRPESPAKGLYGRFRLEHVEDVEAVRALASGMKQETFEGESDANARLAARQSADDFLVPFAGERRRFVYSQYQHQFLLGHQPVRGCSQNF